MAGEDTTHLEVGDPDGPVTAAALNGRLGPLSAGMGIRFTNADAARLEATMPVAGNTQPFGLLHGGANAVLAETLGSVAAMLHGAPLRYPVGIELNCSHHRSARQGSVHGVCTPLSLGRSLTSHVISISDDDGRLMCTARLTCMLREFSPPRG